MTTARAAARQGAQPPTVARPRAVRHQRRRRPHRPGRRHHRRDDVRPHRCGDRVRPHPRRHRADRPATILPRLDPAGLQRALERARAASLEVVAGAGGQDQLVVGFPIRTGVARRRLRRRPAVDVDGAHSNGCSATRWLCSPSAARWRCCWRCSSGVLLTGRALRPLRRLTATSQRLAGGDLRARSGVDSRHDEIGSLARIVRRHGGAHRAVLRRPAGVGGAHPPLHRRRLPRAAHPDHRAQGLHRRHPPRRHPRAAGARRRARGDGARGRPHACAGARPAHAGATRRTAARRIRRRSTSAPPSPHHLDEGVPGMPDTRSTGSSQPSVLASVDRAALATIVRNLLVNACKYAPGAPQRWRTFARGRPRLPRGARRGPRHRGRRPRPRVRALLPRREDAGPRGGRQRPRPQHRAGPGARQPRRRGDRQHRGPRHDRDRLVAHRRRAADVRAPAPPATTAKPA